MAVFPNPRSPAQLRKALADQARQNGLVVTASSAFGGAGLLIETADTLRSAQATSIATTDVVTAAADFTVDNAVARVDGTSGKIIQESTLKVSDTGVITQTDPAVTPNPIFIVITTLAAITFEIRVYTAALESLGIGADAGGSVTTGNKNIFIGKSAGLAVTEGSSNIIIGASAGEELVTSGENILIGYQAGQFATGEGNVFIGPLAGQGSSGSSDGDENIAIGANAGRALETTTGNVLIGKNAGVNLTTGVANFCVGANAGTQLVTGDSNVFFGNNSGSNTSTSVSEVTAVGRTTCPDVTGDGNTAIGFQAGNDVTSGSNNTFIGRNSGNNASQLVTAANSIAVGNNTFTTANSQAMLGPSNVTQTILRGTVEVTRASSAACRINVYNTTDIDPVGALYERFRIQWSSNAVQVGTGAAGGGTVRNWALHRGSVQFVNFVAAGVVVNDGGADLDFRVEGDTLTHMIFAEGNAASENIALLATAVPNWQSMDRGIFIGNRTAAPSADPTNGVFVYVTSGELIVRNTSGAISQVSGTRRGAAASTADGGTITHGLGATPAGVIATGSVAGEIITVTALGATTFTVAIKQADGTTAGTSQTIYWMAFT